MRGLRKHAVVTTALAAAVLAACGGGVLAVIGFLGSAGGDWKFANPAVTDFEQRQDCGTGANQACFVNIQIDGQRSLFSSGFDVSYRGNVVPGCPIAETPGGTVRGDRIVLPNCFSGRYVTINEVVSDDGSLRAFFDTELPELTTGVWVEIQTGHRRFKFINDTTGCELTTPRTPVALTIVPADLSVPRTQTEIVGFSAGGKVWSGRFVGLSGMRLTSGTEVLELERRNLNDAC